MSDVAVDASVFGKLLFPEEYSDLADALVADALAAGDRIVGPHLLPVEVTTIIRRQMRAARLPLVEAQEILGGFLAYPIELIEDAGLHREALALTARFSLGAHDAHYVALVQLLGCDVWFADVRVMRAVAGRLPFVRWLGHYQSVGSTT